MRANLPNRGVEESARIRFRPLRFKCLLSKRKSQEKLAHKKLICFHCRDECGQVSLCVRANGAILCNTSKYLAPPQRGHLQGTGAGGRELMFSTLPPQHVRIGSVKLSEVPFFCLAGTQKDSRAKGFDGVLSTGLFRRVFICHSDHFVILEPR